MQQLLKTIRNCKECQAHLPLGPNPVLQASISSKIVIIGQAPGTKVHKSGIPWDDASGNQLRRWLDVDSTLFYNTDIFAIVPMGFCYPGKGRSGDLPPRPECAPLWHDKLMKSMTNVKLTLLIGQYAQRYYLNEVKDNLTETVKSYKEYLPQYFPLPHPSPRNRFWLSKNPWFEEDVLPVLKENVKAIIR